MTAPPAPPPGPRVPGPFLALTALLCGALVMVVEVLGSRVIGPFFGVSLFVWTALITVTLLALAAGYAAGGVLADRGATPDRLYALIGAAGALALLVPLLRAPVLKACVPLGLRAGALLSAAALFGPVLALLGCVTPLLVRIAVREWASIGRTVGLLSALSTLGSVAGTVLAGFVLIPRLGVTRVFAGTGVALLLLAAGWFLGVRRRLRALAPLALPLALLAHAEPATVRLVRPSGTRVERVFARDGRYGRITVVDYIGGPVHSREMNIDGLTQGGLDLRSGLSVYPYASYLELLPRALHPAGTRCLVLGLGAGLVPAWYERQGVRTDVVDIDPAVVAAARDWFGYAAAERVRIADARHFLATARERYDYVVLDVFNGDVTPGHLLSVEALRLVRERLAPGGVLAMNLIGDLRGATLMTASVVRTMEEVFDTVSLHPAFDPDAGDGTGNLALLAYDGPRRTPGPDLLRGAPVHPLARAAVARMALPPFRFPPGTPALVLTDDYNPIDLLDLGLREGLRRAILRSTDWDVLI